MADGFVVDPWEAELENSPTYQAKIRGISLDNLNTNLDLTGLDSESTPFAGITGYDPESVRQLRSEAESRSYLTSLPLAVSQGMRSALGDTAQLVARAEDAIAGTANRFLGTKFQTDTADKYVRASNLEAMTQGQDFAARQIRGATRSLGTMVLGGLLGRAIGNPKAGVIGLPGLIAANKAFTEAKDSGLSTGQALAYSGIQGAIESGITYGMGKAMGSQGVQSTISRAVGGKAIKPIVFATFKDLLKSFAVNSAQELPEELAIEAASNATEYMFGVNAKEWDGWTNDPSRIARDTATSILDIVTQVGLIGGAAKVGDFNSTMRLRRDAQRLGVTETQLRGFVDRFNEEASKTDGEAASPEVFNKWIGWLAQNKDDAQKSREEIAKANYTGVPYGPDETAEQKQVRSDELFFNDVQALNAGMGGKARSSSQGRLNTARNVLDFIGEIPPEATTPSTNFIADAANALAENPSRSNFDKLKTAILDFSKIVKPPAKPQESPQSSADGQAAVGPTVPTETQRQASQEPQQTADPDVMDAEVVQPDSVTVEQSSAVYPDSQVEFSDPGDQAAASEANIRTLRDLVSVLRGHMKSKENVLDAFRTGKGGMVPIGMSGESAVATVEQIWRDLDASDKSALEEISKSEITQDDVNPVDSASEQGDSALDSATQVPQKEAVDVQELRDQATTEGQVVPAQAPPSSVSAAEPVAPTKAEGQSGPIPVAEILSRRGSTTSASTPNLEFQTKEGLNVRADTPRHKIGGGEKFVSDMELGGLGAGLSESEANLARKVESYRVAANYVSIVIQRKLDNGVLDDSPELKEQAIKTLEFARSALSGKPETKSEKVPESEPEPAPETTPARPVVPQRIDKRYDSKRDELMSVFGYDLLPAKNITPQMSAVIDTFMTFRGVSPLWVDDPQSNLKAPAMAWGDGTIILNSRLISGDFPDSNAIWHIVGDEVAHATKLDTEIAPALKKNKRLWGSLKKEYLSRAVEGYKPEGIQLDREATALFVSKVLGNKNMRSLVMMNKPVWIKVADRILKWFGLNRGVESLMSSEQLAVVDGLRKHVAPKKDVATKNKASSSSKVLENTGIEIPTDKDRASTDPVAPANLKQKPSDMNSYLDALSETTKRDVSDVYIKVNKELSRFVRNRVGADDSSSNFNRFIDADSIVTDTFIALGESDLGVNAAKKSMKDFLALAKTIASRKINDAFDKATAEKRGGGNVGSIDVSNEEGASLADSIVAEGQSGPGEEITVRDMLPGLELSDDEWIALDAMIGEGNPVKHTRAIMEASGWKETKSRRVKNTILKKVREGLSPELQSIMAQWERKNSTKDRTDSSVRNYNAPEVDALKRTVVRSQINKTLERSTELNDHKRNAPSVPHTPTELDENGDVEAISANTIRMTLEKVWGVPLAIEQTKAPPFTKKPAGQYLTKEHRISLLKTTFGSIGLQAHEVAHHLQNVTDVIQSIAGLHTKYLYEIVTKIRRASPGTLQMLANSARMFGLSDQGVNAILNRDTRGAFVSVNSQYGSISPNQLQAYQELLMLSPRLWGLNPAQKLQNATIEDAEEGFAELVRYVVSHNGTIPGGATTAKYMLNKWLDSNPEYKEKINATTDMMNRYINEGAMKRVQATIGDNPDRPEESFGLRAFREIDDMLFYTEANMNKYQPFRGRIQQAIDKAGPRPNQKTAGVRGIRYATTIADEVQYYSTISQNLATSAVVEGITGVAGQSYGRRYSTINLRDAVAEGLRSDDDHKDFGAYAKAQLKLEIENDRRAQIANDPGLKIPEYQMGVSYSDAEKIVSDISKDPERMRRFDVLQQRIRQVYLDLYEMLYDAGLISEKAKQSSGKWERYISMKRVFDNADKQDASIGNDLMEVHSPFRSRTAEGGEYKSVDPVAEAFRAVYSAYNSATRHLMVDKLVSEMDPVRGGAHGLGYILHRLDPNLKSDKFAMKQIWGELKKMLSKHGMSQDDIRALRKDKDFMGHVFRVWSTTAKANRPKGIMLHMESESWNDNLQLVVKKEPELVMYKISDDLQYAIENLAPALSRVGGKVGTFLRIAKAITSFVGKGLTHFRPPFWLKNIPNDAWSFVERSKYATNTATAGLAIAGSFKELARNRFGHKNQMIDMYQADVGTIAAYGGERARSIEGIVSDTKRRGRKQAGVSLSRDIYNRPIEHLSETVGNALHKVSVFGAMSEFGPRYAEYVLSMRSMGYGVDRSGNILDLQNSGQIIPLTDVPREVRIKASNDARDVTVDFSAAGFWGQIYGIFVPLGAAQITGTHQKWRYRLDELKKMFETGDYGTVKRIATASGARWLRRVLAMAVTGAIYHYLSRDDDDYANEADWHKAQWFSTPIGRIPKGRDTGLFINIGQAIAMAIDGDFKGAKALVGDSMWNEAILPTFTGTPIAEAFANRRLTMGWDYVEIDQEDKKVFNKYLAGEDTLYTSKAIASGLTFLPGSDETGASPNRVQHVLNGMTGNLYGGAMGFVEDFATQANSLISGEDNLHVPPNPFDQFVRYKTPVKTHKELRDVSNETEKRINHLNTIKPDTSDPEKYQKWYADMQLLQNTKYASKQVQDLRGDVWQMLVEARANKDVQKIQEYESYVSGAVRAVNGEPELNSYPNPYKPEAQEGLPEEIRDVIENQLIRMSYHASEATSFESDRKKSPDEDFSILAARKFLDANGWDYAKRVYLLREYWARRGWKTKPSSERVQRVGK